MNLMPAKTEFDLHQHQDIRDGVRAAMAADKLTQADVSRQTEVPPSTLSTYLRGEYDGDNNVPAVKLQRWLDARNRLASARLRMPEQPSFVALGVASKIMQRFDVAFAMGRLILCGGEPGAGKSAAARHYAANNPRVWLATMDSTTSGVPTMLLEILAAMGVPDVKGTPQSLLKRVVDKALEEKGLIIVDEAQHLGNSAIETLRAINDRTRERGRGVGVAIVGNDGVYSRVGSTGTKADFAQVSSRFSNRTWISKPDPRDVVLYSQAYADANREVIGHAELEYLKSIAAKPGGLRNVEMTFENALLVAIGTNQPLSLEHLQGAFAALSGLAHAA